MCGVRRLQVWGRWQVPRRTALKNSVCTWPHGINYFGKSAISSIWVKSPRVLCRVFEAKHVVKFFKLGAVALRCAVVDRTATTRGILLYCDRRNEGTVEICACTRRRPVRWSESIHCFNVIEKLDLSTKSNPVRSTDDVEFGYKLYCDYLRK